MPEEHGCPVRTLVEECDAGYVIARGLDAEDKVIALHIYVVDPEDAAELDALLTEWERARDERPEGHPCR